MKGFIFNTGLWLVAMLELIPGVWHVGYALGKWKAKKECVHILRFALIVKEFFERVQRLQGPTVTSSPEVVGMLGGQGGGKTYLARALSKVYNAYHIDVNEIRLYLEERDMGQGNARYVAFMVAEGLAGLGYNVIIDMSHDLAFTRGYMEKIIRMFAGEYRDRVTFSYAQNDVTWEDVSEEYVFCDHSRWYDEAARKRFPDLSGLQLRISESESTQDRFYWPNGQLIRRSFPGLRIVKADKVRSGVRAMSSDEVNATS